jgi:thymidylate synthase
MFPESRTAAAGYQEAVAAVLNHGTPAPPVIDPASPASRFGARPRAALELIGHGFSIAASALSLPIRSARPVDLPYAIGLMLWTLAGSEAVEWLSYYNAKAPKFSDDGERLCGSFGKRLISPNGSINQIEVCIARLRADPGTRRAFAAILTPEDTVSPRMDFPCAAGVQYFTRDGQLISVTFMRAQHALNLLPLDGFVFRGLQQYVAVRLGLKVGAYHHYCGTLHLYNDELNIAADTLSEPVIDCVLGDMVGGNALKQLFEFEARLRSSTGDAGESISAIASQPLPNGSFEEAARLILLMYALETSGGDPMTLIDIGLASEGTRALCRRHWTQS